MIIQRDCMEMNRTGKLNPCKELAQIELDEKRGGKVSNEKKKFKPFTMSDSSFVLTRLKARKDLESKATCKGKLV